MSRRTALGVLFGHRLALPDRLLDPDMELEGLLVAEQLRRPGMSRAAAAIAVFDSRPDLAQAVNDKIMTAAALALARRRGLPPSRSIYMAAVSLTSKFKNCNFQHAIERVIRARPDLTAAYRAEVAAAKLAQQRRNRRNRRRGRHAA